MKALRGRARLRTGGALVVGLALWYTGLVGVAGAATLTEFPIPTFNSLPQVITAGPDGARWFAEEVGNKIGRITTNTGAVSALAAAVLPTDRTALVGGVAEPATAAEPAATTVTTFATILNIGQTTALGCAIAPITVVPATNRIRVRFEGGGGGTGVAVCTQPLCP